MDLINRENIIIFPFLPTSGTEEMLRDIAWQNVPEDVFYDNEEYLMDMCWDVVKAFVNMVKSEPTVKAIPLPICQDCQYYEPNTKYCKKLECDNVKYNDGCAYWIEKGSVNNGNY